jgi:hypothetical protein
MIANKINRLRSLTSFSSARFSADSKVLFHQHTPALAEFELNVPKTLNAVDLDMVNIMTAKLA